MGVTQNEQAIAHTERSANGISLNWKRFVA